ncbi:MAG: chorismate synthase [Spirochaetaceae bacterium]|jgi:chorismate synthase|nr:chorismate synthase [Spirochaetaceae bacterium]
MARNTFGKNWAVTTFGESHGAAVGCVIDGCPAGLPLNTAEINAELARRRPGRDGGAAAVSTPRAETDECEVLSGVYEGHTLGTPIAIIIRNMNTRSSDYDELKDIYRPGHADSTWDAKYGFRDYRGGGRSSGRETAARVAAGAVAKKFLIENGITILGWTESIGEITAPDFGAPDFCEAEIERNPFRLPSKDVEKAAALIKALRTEGDSIGGVVRCRVTGLPAALGEPVFGKLDAALAEAMLSIGAVKGFEIGAGFAASRLKGSQNNDINANHSGGVLGGISTGAPLEFRAAFKPVPSIAMEQQALSKDGAVRLISIKGRHDVCIAPRALPVVEAMAALILADFVLEQRLARVNLPPYADGHA